MRVGLIALVVVIAAAIIAALQSFFIVNPTQQALVLQFGEVRQAVREPGLNTKIPFIQDTLYLDKRVLDLNVPAQEIIAADQKRLVVDAFMRYRIANPVRFYQAVNNVREGASRLSTFVQASLRAVLADATFTDIVRDDRPSLMQRIKADVADRARDIGVDVVDVKIRRADLPEANSEAIYARMQTEREQEAREIRAQGQEAAQRVRAAADRTATVLRAEAQREAEQIRGQGDGQKNAIFARAYTADPQFFAFYRAMQAYVEGLQSQDTRLVLSPDADFFRFFNDPLGAGELFVDSAAGAPQPDTDAAPPGPVSTREVPGAAEPGGDGTGAAAEATSLEAIVGADPANPTAVSVDRALVEPEATVSDNGEGTSVVEPVTTDAAPADATPGDATPGDADEVSGSPDAAPVEPAASEADVAAAAPEAEPAEASTDAALATAEPAPSDAANEAAGAEATDEDGTDPREAELAATAADEDPAEASTEAAVESASPSPSPAANAAANETPGPADEAEAGARADAAGIGETERGTVTIVRPDDAVE